MKITEKLSLLTRKSVEKEIDGTTWVLYPISIGAMRDLRTVGLPLFKLVKGLFKGPASGDNSQTVENVKTSEGDIRTTTHIAETSLELVKFRAEEEAKALESAVEALLGDETRSMLGRLIADMLRDDFGPKPDPNVVREFVDGLDLVTVGKLLSGFLEVNASVFGPLAPKVRSAIQDKIRGAVQAESADPAPSPAN